MNEDTYRTFRLILFGWIIISILGALILSIRINVADTCDEAQKRKKKLIYYWAVIIVVFVILLSIMYAAHTSVYPDEGFISTLTEGVRL